MKRYILQTLIRLCRCQSVFVQKVHFLMLQLFVYLFTSSSGVVLQVSLCYGQLSVIHPSSTFHIFDISRIISWIELKLGGRHWTYKEVQNCELHNWKSFHSNIQDGRHGCNLETIQTTSSKLLVRLSQNLMGGIWETWRFRLLDLFHSSIQDGTPQQSSRKSSNDISKTELDWAQTWWDALGRHGDSELQKSFCSHIQDGHHDFKWHLLPNH